MSSQGVGDHVAADGFRLRGTSMSRVDGFSDVVFGFALTLLVVSLEVPKSFEELSVLVRGFVPFAISFTLLLMIWHAHFQFFRRFGLHDSRTILLNSMLLFVVLFYVYPLKFLFTLMIGEFMGNGSGLEIAHASQSRDLMLLYGVGYAAIYALFTALYLNAWRQRASLQLNHLEEVLTRTYIWEVAGMATIGLLSCVLALLLPPARAGLAGFAYMLIGVFKTVHGMVGGRATRRALEAGAISPTERDAGA